MLPTCYPRQLYVTFMMAFRGVVEKCLRMQLAEDWEAAVVHFSATLDLMKVTFNTTEGVKFHIIEKGEVSIKLSDGKEVNSLTTVGGLYKLNLVDP